MVAWTKAWREGGMLEPKAVEIGKPWPPSKAVSPPKHHCRLSLNLNAG